MYKPYGLRLSKLGEVLFAAAFWSVFIKRGLQKLLHWLLECIIAAAAPTITILTALICGLVGLIAGINDKR